VGSAVMVGLAADGSEGVRKVFEGINEELRTIMSFTNSTN
jgi:isopentenyl diphosphate isomerase/L-lactate dehydrogenase-like FMN-dependent dehydrogenase